jgi:hypothetical protein
MGGGLLSAPKIDQQNDKKAGQNEPRNHNDLDPQLANSRNVVVHIRISIKEPVPIAKDVRASKQIDDEEERCGYSQSRKSHWVNCCEHMISMFVRYCTTSQASKAGHFRKESIR